MAMGPRPQVPSSQRPPPRASGGAAGVATPERSHLAVLWRGGTCLAASRVARFTAALPSRSETRAAVLARSNQAPTHLPRRGAIEPTVADRRDGPDRSRRG